MPDEFDNMDIEGDEMGQIEADIDEVVERVWKLAGEGDFEEIQRLARVVDGTTFDAVDEALLVEDLDGEVYLAWAP